MVWQQLSVAWFGSTFHTIFSHLFTVLDLLKCLPAAAAESWLLLLLLLLSWLATAERWLPAAFAELGVGAAELS